LIDDYLRRMNEEAEIASWQPNQTCSEIRNKPKESNLLSSSFDKESALI